MPKETQAQKLERLGIAEFYFPGFLSGKRKVSPAEASIICDFILVIAYDMKNN